MKHAKTPVGAIHARELVKVIPANILVIPVKDIHAREPVKVIPAKDRVIIHAKIPAEATHVMIRVQ
jgi:hypothetical protein